MDRKIVAVASDHAGVNLKAVIIDELRALGYEALDLGTNGSESVDYPDFGYRLAQAVASGKAASGVGVCGSGIGIAMALNRYAKVRAALCTDATMARLARAHNDANVLVMGERLIGVETARDCLRTFLQTPFAGGRHAGRVEKLNRGL
ncbi:MAG: ribose 5-phosphate isomerase B [Alphaproteobacteria bacterium]|nr:MAG: ribose 5-phosphate isomerase B [Alphaproteobacteria bacterium]